jgi:hypothetical protein
VSYSPRSYFAASYFGATAPAPSSPPPSLSFDFLARYLCRPVLSLGAGFPAPIDKTQPPAAQPRISFDYLAGFCAASPNREPAP